MTPDELHTRLTEVAETLRIALDAQTQRLIHDGYQDPYRVVTLDGSPVLAPLLVAYAQVLVALRSQP